MLGSGGFGITYLADDTQLTRQVAIKEYFPLFAHRDSQTRRIQANGSETNSDYRDGLCRFLSEARKLAQFKHAYIVHENRYSNETQHRVCVHDNDGYWMSQTEVTIGHYLSCVQAKACRPPEWLEAGNQYNIHTGSNDWYKKVGMSESNPQHPTTGVSWKDAVKFAAWLQQQSGKSYRLPTAAEWEYAARAGSNSPYGQTQGGTAISAANLSRYAWFWDNANKQTHPVGAKPANPWGLQDMIGNVWEWTCSDYANPYDGNEQQCAKKLK